MALTYCIRIREEGISWKILHIRKTVCSQVYISTLGLQAIVAFRWLGVGLNGMFLLTKAKQILEGRDGGLGEHNELQIL